MGYVLPPLPADASPEFRMMYRRHLLKAFYAGPYRSLDKSPMSAIIDAMTDEEIEAHQLPPRRGLSKWLFGRKDA